MNRINQALGGCDRAAIRPLVHHLVKAHYPTTVVDYGCGDGAWLSEFHRLGIRTIGVDRTDRIRHDIGAFVAHDLSKPGINFDNAVVGVRVEEPSIALCLEVAEHLPCSAADGLIDILTAHPVVAFSAAIPGQGGWGHKNERWQSWWAAKFAGEMFAPGSEEAKAAGEWGYLAGLWHDLGKFAPEWQEYLKSKSDPHIAEVSAFPSKREDHSTAGAAYTHMSAGLKPFGDLLSYIIAGHHAGLADAVSLFGERLPKQINEWRCHAETAGVPLNESLPLPPLTRADAGNDGMAFMLRFFFSCLVDADFLATESFMRPDRAELRQIWPEDICSARPNRCCRPQRY